MRKILLLISMVFICTCVWGQQSGGRGVMFGITPWGKVGMRTTSNKQYYLTNKWSIKSPSYQIGYERHLGKYDMLLEAGYSKMTFQDRDGNDSITSGRFSFQAFPGYTILPGKRVQIPLYIGIGASIYNKSVGSNFYLDFGVRARLKVYLSNQIALYGGAFYMIGFGKNKSMENLYGVDAGILFSF